MSSHSEVWLRHLSSSLKASRQAAYLWHVEEDRYEFMGDVSGVLGMSEENLPKGKEEFSKLISPQDVVTRQLALADLLRRSKDGDINFSLQYKLARSDGKFIPVSETGTVHFDKITGKTTVHSLMALDTKAIERQMKVFRKRELKEEVSHVFSGNMGRQALLQEIERVMGDPLRDPSKGCLLVVGIDRLSLINEVYGSQVADEVLIQTGERLKTMVGEQALIVQSSGDVFALLFPRMSQSEMGDVAQNILKVFYHQPIATKERVIHTVVSIGGVRLDELTLRPSSIVTRAEMALQRAKEQGRGCYVAYTEKFTEEVNDFRDVLSIGDQFLKGFREGRVKMAFQGIVNSRTNDISFHECLIRLIDEQGNVQTAGKFIPAVEKMGLTRLVDGYCVQQAIGELKMFPDINLSVNVSNHTLTDPAWLKDVSAELRDREDVATRLIVEITESAAMADVNQTMRVIRTLQDLGCRIALDDFGAGQTAFTQLKDLSLDIVKIDKSFVREMDKEENKLFIKTLHSLASSMNLETVGEGAETLAEADVLAKDGVDHIQGFVYGLPSMERTWLAAEHELRHPSSAVKEKAAPDSKAAS
jgi:diguanylate cyclase (GGDEF)-like protein